MIESNRRHAILFVDDDAQVLRAIKRQLRAYTDRWETVFVSGGTEALEAIEKKPFDVLVTDMVMPGIDGATLLHHVKEHHPGMLRIVLSGNTEPRNAQRAVPFAHQRLLKPWDRNGLVTVLESGSRLLDLVGDEVIRKSISGIGALPSAPATYAKLSTMIDDESASFVEVAELIASDMAMSAKLLQLANSAFVSAGRPITTVTDAVRTLGLSVIREYVLNPVLQVFDIYAPKALTGTDGFGRLKHHGAQVAFLCKQLVPDPRLRQMAFLTGLLHDIGKLVLLSKLPLEAAAIDREVADKACSVEDVELRRLGVTHAEIGGYLLGLWGIPQEICRAVAGHHGGQAGGAPDLLTDTLSLANWLVNEVDARRERGVTNEDVFVHEVEPHVLERFGGMAEVIKLVRNAEASLSSGRVEPPIFSSPP